MAAGAADSQQDRRGPENLNDVVARLAGVQPEEPNPGERGGQLWPELFAELDENQRNAIGQAFAANRHE